MTFSNEDKLAAVERELRFRRRVYLDRVAKGKMKPSLADHQISIFEDIAEDYRAKASAERLL